MTPRQRKEKNEAAQCPFCNEFLQIPEDIKTASGSFTGGRCSCGTVFVCDPTGHNLGEAYLEALLYACDEDWGVFNSLNADIRYDEAVFNYDLRAHRLWNTRDVRRDYSGKIIFIKVTRPIE